MAKNNVTRLLDARKIVYQAFTFSEEIHSAEEAAAAMGVSAHEVYKTLVVLRESSMARRRGNPTCGAPQRASPSARPLGSPLPLHCCGQVGNPRRPCATVDDVGGRHQQRGRPLLVLVPGGRQVDLRRLAAAVGEKKLHMATQREAEALTGLLVGGISALALLHKGFPVYIDESACRLDRIYVSGGQRGLNICLAVADFVRLTGAKAVPAAEEGTGI